MDFLFSDLSSTFVVSVPVFMLLGCFVGFIAGLLGVGGGAVLVPALYYLGHLFYQDRIPPEILMHTALGTSMSIIIPTGISSSMAQIKRGAVDWDSFKLMAPTLVLGVIFGVFVVAGLDSYQLKIVFAVGLYALAALIFFKKENGEAHPVLRKWFVAGPVSAVVGVFSTLVGIGGATLNVPYLNRAGIPLHRAIATSSVLGVMISIPAAAGFILIGERYVIEAPGFFGFVNLWAWLLIVPFSVVMAPFGVKASHALPVQKLKYIFACLLCMIASKMAYEVLVV